MSFFKRKPSTKPVETAPRVRPRPSLPELKSPRDVQWPENLVDMESIQHIPPHAAKSSLRGSDQPIPFHKPFRGGSDNNLHHGSAISSIYMADTPDVSNENWRTSAAPIASSRHKGTHRRPKLAPTFNLMVAGAQGTGKTNFLRLLLETADVSPTATLDQRAALNRFLHGGSRTTAAIETVCIEITESRFDRVLFSVVDTPGLDFVEGRELKLDRQVSTLIHYIDAQYADTMSEESKVVRKSKGDQHIHLCVYLIDPDSIMTAATRRSLSSLPGKSRSQTTVSAKNPPDLIPDTASLDSEEGDAHSPLTMAPAELRVLKRLSARTNVLPVIARADSLTDDKLAAVKQAVRDDLIKAGVGFGVFGDNLAKSPTANGAPRKTQFVDARENGHAEENGKDEEDEDEERASRPVIKLRPSRHARRNLSRSRSRRDLSSAVEDPDAVAHTFENDTESVASVRFSAHVIAKTDLSSLIPFAIITPENIGHHRRSDSPAESTVPSSPMATSENGHHSSLEPLTPASVRSVQLNYLDGPPADLKGVFVRKFRWGTVDVLNPDHCDFSALRTSILSTHLKILKTTTKEVLYEKYRTEKLLARRATSHISEEERQRLLEDLGL